MKMTGSASIFRLALLALLVAGLVSPAAAATALDAQEQSAVAWLKSAAQPFSDTQPSEAELARMLPAFDGAKVIGIGEATHGDHQDQAFKTELIKALVRAGRVQVLALECNRIAAEGFDAYIREGQGDPVALIQSPSFFRIWKDDEFADLILWLRAWNRTAAKPIRITGTDMQDAIQDAAAALEFVRGQDPALAEQLAKGLGALASPAAQQSRFYVWALATPPEAYAKAQAGVQALEQTLDAKAAAWSGRPGWRRARHAAMLAGQGLRVFELEAGRPDLDKSKLPMEYLGRRDRWMAGNLLSELAPDETAVLWAHDGHILPLIDDQPNEGATLRRALGPAYRAVGFTWSRGAFIAQALDAITGAGMTKTPDAAPQTLSNDRPGDLGFVFDQVGPDRFWIDVRKLPPEQTAFGARRYYRGYAGWGLVLSQWQTDPQDQLPITGGFDILVYFRRITPSHQWPRPK
jgi:erythromycin esterase